MKMKTYKVQLISKDKNVYETDVKASSDDAAINKAFENIKQRGWDRFEYKLKQLERIS